MHESTFASYSLKSNPWLCTCYLWIPHFFNAQDIDRTILFPYLSRHFTYQKTVRYNSVGKAVTHLYCEVHRLMWCKSRQWQLNWALGPWAVLWSVGVWPQPRFRPPVNYHPSNHRSTPLGIDPEFRFRSVSGKFYGRKRNSVTVSDLYANSFPIPLPFPSFLYSSDSVFRIQKIDEFGIGIGTKNK